MFLAIKLCTELFEIELFICIKIDLALNYLERVIYHKYKQFVSLSCQKQAEHSRKEENIKNE